MKESRASRAPALPEAGDTSDVLGFGADMRIAREHLPRHVPGDFHDRSSPAPFSASSVISVCRLSCQRQVTPALMRTLFQAVFSDPIDFAGSFGKRLPPGNTNHSGFTSPKCFAYQRVCSSSAWSSAPFNGMVRPVPAVRGIK